MAKDDRTRDLMDYETLQQNALLAVVRAAMQRAAAPGGLPGDHHFYITFRTTAPGVVIPPELLARYPEEMTIVLQNQFWDLEAGETGFSVTLQFGGQLKSMSIPYGAITRFYDPSVQYGLQFNPSQRAEPPATPRPRTPPATLVVTSAEPIRAALIEAPKIVSLDQFRKK
jgi:hypothetical protein